MSERDPEYLTEEEATQLWQRAAQLQAEAARQAELRAEDTVAPEADAERGTPAAGYALTHVRAAALEAGIGEEYVEAALADVRAERALPRRASLSRRLLRRIVPDAPDTITVRRVIDATPADVLGAMELILPPEPYRLALVDRRGDPLDGGVLVFDIQGAGFGAMEGFAGDASWADLRQLHMSLRPIPGSHPSCELTIRGPISWAHGLNLAFAGVFGGLGGGAGLALGSVGAGVAATIAAAIGLGVTGIAALTTGVAIAGAVGGGLIGARAFRAVYDHAMRTGERALSGMCSAVSLRAQGGWAISDHPRRDPTALP